MATAISKDIKEYVFEWEGKDRNGKPVRGEVRAAGENQVQATLRRQGVMVQKVKKTQNRFGQTHQAQRHRHFYAPTGHHDESRGATAAVL